LLVSLAGLGSPVFRNSPDAWVGVRAENPEQDMDGDPEELDDKPIQTEGPTSPAQRPDTTNPVQERSIVHSLKPILLAVIRAWLWRA
jgi:hypothetical protein